MNFYIKKKAGKFITHTVNWLGIVVGDYHSHTVSFDESENHPYISVVEGFVSHLETISNLNLQNNIDIVMNNEIVVSKRINDTPTLTFDCSDGYLLYNQDDYDKLQNEILHWESIKDDVVYLGNTETLSHYDGDVVNKNVAGLASGTFVAEFAYKYKSSKVVFFDYSKSSIKFQQEMIMSSNRRGVLEQYFDKFITGRYAATWDDINALNMNYINTIYDNLRDVELEFIYCDLRHEGDIHLLFSKLDNTYTLWISNVFYYVTSFNESKFDCIKLLYSLCEKHRVDLLPHCRISYES